MTDSRASPPTLIRQPDDDYAYTYSNHGTPIARVECGQRVLIETMDAFHDRIRDERDLPSQATPGYPFVNPLTGPISIVGAEPGDTLVATIHEIHPTRDYAVTALVHRFGALTPTKTTPMLTPALPEKTRILPIRDGRVWFDDRRALPFNPFVGSMGVAPRMEAISSITPGPWGGNMDCVETRPGVNVLFPVFEPGAQFFIGDAHALQGDGEITGVAAEMPASIEVSFELRKQKSLEWPRIQTPDYLMSVGSARPLEDATRIACDDLIRWLVDDFGFESIEAYELLGLALELRVGNIVDPNYTVVAKLPIAYL